MNENERRWHIATAVLITIWVVAVARLMVADVWDETNALVALGRSTWTTAEAVRFVLTQSMGIWRPIPSAFAVLVIRAIGDPDIAWRVMRGINIALLLASLWLLVAAMNRWSGPSARRTALFTLTFLYSAGAVITAGWFANLFDAWTLADRGGAASDGARPVRGGWSHLRGGVLLQGDGGAGVAFSRGARRGRSHPLA